LQGECKAISRWIRGEIAEIAEIANRLRGNIKVIARRTANRLCGDCAVIAVYRATTLQRCTAIERRLRGDFAAIARRLRCDFAAI
jgi:hypothetical protein